MVIIKWPYAAMRNTLCVTLLHIAGLAVEGNSQEHWTQFAVSTWWSHTCVRLITNILTSSRQSWRSKQVKLLQISSPPHLFFSLLYSSYKYIYLKTFIACSHFSCVIQEQGLNSDCEFLRHRFEGSSSHSFSYIWAMPGCLFFLFQTNF